MKVSTLKYRFDSKMKLVEQNTNDANNKDTYKTYSVLFKCFVCFVFIHISYYLFVHDNRYIFKTIKKDNNRPLVRQELRLRSKR